MFIKGEAGGLRDIPNSTLNMPFMRTCFAENKKLMIFQMNTSSLKYGRMFNQDYKIKAAIELTVSDDSFKFSWRITDVDSDFAEGELLRRLQEKNDK